jgi:fluoroacetyl-CoA thioesterase
MKPGLAVGHTYEYSIQVEKDMQAQLAGRVIHPLYSTAAMIAHMEWASRQHILPYLEPGEEGVGFHVDVKHLAPAPIGALVKIRSTVSDISERRVTSQVEAWHDATQIGVGTFTQALVPMEKLYQHASELMPGQTPCPPPAVLNAMSGQHTFSLEVLKWETGMFPCTRYDEWLICRLSLNQGQYEGPCLLHYEIEEWIEAIRTLADGTRSGYQSDFLEPVLTVQMTAGEAGEWECFLLLNDPRSTGPSSTGAKNTSARLIVDKAALQEFANRLREQLAGFPSRL